VSGYLNAYLNGGSWPTGPSPVISSYYSNALFIYLNGEVYTEDPSQPAPLKWAPAP